MLSPAFSAALRSTIATDHATPSREVTGRPAPVESRQTTHFSVTDDRGNAVALTTTINGWYGSAVTVTGAGFLLNNEMDDFAAQAGHAEHVRPGPGRSQRHRARQADALGDDADASCSTPTSVRCS